MDTRVIKEPAELKDSLDRLWEISGEKIRKIAAGYDFSAGSPVFTSGGRYGARGWTEWTEGFLYGSALLQYDAAGDGWFLEYGRSGTVQRMSSHLTHFGVHDHGFNTVSTYGNLLRLMNEGRIPDNEWERRYYELALKVSGAVQAARWTPTADGGGYIYSFNGPHSLFADTIRSLRSLALAYQLGQYLMGENDRKISLLDRLVAHAVTTARYTVYYGEGRDLYDRAGRVAHESIFNTNDGNYRCPNSQQGYSPFSTWTRGLAWIILGFSEELEFLSSLPPEELEPFGGRDQLLPIVERAAVVTADFYIRNTPSDGIPYWDTGAPGLSKLGNYLEKPADPFNGSEPVDSSAAAIASQGLLRLGRYLSERNDPRGSRYFQSGLAILSRLIEEPYLSLGPDHQGLLLHSVYHRPNAWDYVPKNGSVPSGESSMWGDYHLREAALFVQHIIDGKPYLVFWRKKI